jgi:hypothetical protein
VPSQVIAPQQLVKAAQPLASPQRMMGVFPYQWQFPGPHAKHVLANGTLALPPADASVNAILTYQVPTGLRFSLRGVVFQFVGTGWIQGSGDLVFSLQVTDAGSREVDFLNSVETQLGSVEFPYPILGPLEFAPESFLTVNVQNNAVAVTADQFCIAHLVGHTYPNAEWGGGV